MLDYSPDAWKIYLIILGMKVLAIVIKFIQIHYEKTENK